MSKLLKAFDDKEMLNNVISVLTLKADEVFYVYHNDIRESCFRNIEAVIHRYNDCPVTFLKLQDDVGEINEILENNSDLIIDVGGAKYLSLLLFEMGWSYAKDLIYYDSEDNRIKTFREHQVYSEEVFHLQIEDVLQLRGGRILESMHKPLENQADKQALIRIVRNNIHEYPAFIHYISDLNHIVINSEKLDEMTYRLNDSEQQRLLSSAVTERCSDLFVLNENIITFQNRNLKELIGVTGSFLENYLYISLQESGAFDDIRMSAVIDFADEKYKHPVLCEIDCLVLKDNRLLFVSCKSTKADSAALNEVYVHNKRFGNVLSAAVLCGFEEFERRYPSIYAKAEELGIYIADRSCFENDRIATVFESIFDGTYRYDPLT